MSSKRPRGPNNDYYRVSESVIIFRAILVKIYYYVKDQIIDLTVFSVY